MGDAASPSNFNARNSWWSDGLSVGCFSQKSSWGTFTLSVGGSSLKGAEGADQKCCDCGRWELQLAIDFDHWMKQLLSIDLQVTILRGLVKLQVRFHATFAWMIRCRLLKPQV